MSRVLHTLLWLVMNVVSDEPGIKDKNYFLFSKFTFFKIYFAVEEGFTIKTSANKNFYLAGLAVCRLFLTALNLMLLLLFFLSFSFDFSS